MAVRWSDEKTGALEVWINGQRIADASDLSTMWRGESVYPIFENYRPGNWQIGNLITWTNTVYYAGLVKGRTRADVGIP
jgi:hypothetical protein